MSIKLIAFILLITSSLHAQVAPHAEGKTVIYIQDLVSKDHKGLRTLIKKAAEVNVVLEWEEYKTSELGFCTMEGECSIIRQSRIIKNPVAPAGITHYAIKEVVGRAKKKGWKNYRTVKYSLIDARSNQVVKSSDVLHEVFTGGCKPNGMCQQVFGPGMDKQFGTSKTNELMKLINYAISL